MASRRRVTPRERSVTSVEMALIWVARAANTARFVPTCAVCTIPLRARSRTAAPMLSTSAMQATMAFTVWATSLTAESISCSRESCSRSRRVVSAMQPSTESKRDSPFRLPARSRVSSARPLTPEETDCSDWLIWSSA